MHHPFPKQYFFSSRLTLADPAIKAIAQRLGKSTAQVVLRWHFQRGVCAIPKTIRENELKENLDVYNFALTKEDMTAITALDSNYHYLRPRDWFGLPMWDGNLG